MIRRTLVALVLCGLAVAAPPASATFHEMSIREVYPGSSAEPTAEYVELQMWHAGQNLVGQHTLRTYSAGGAPTATVLPSGVSGDANQSTVLIATPEAESRFSGITADAPLASTDQLNPAGGAVCWEEIDCVAWGSFSGALPSPAGPPAAPAGIPDGMALRRTIAPGCSTLLEPTDDRDNSAADFSAVFPNPRPNSTAPTEFACGPTGGGSGGTGGQNRRGAPQTFLRHKPPHTTRDRTPTFRFSSNEPGSRFQCKLDSKPFRPCRSPFVAQRLPLGSHTFRVRARDESDNLDPSPASWRFRVLAKP